MLKRAERKQLRGGAAAGPGAHLNTAEGVAASTLLPSGDQAKKVTPPPPNHCSWTQFSVDTSHTWRGAQWGWGGHWTQRSPTATGTAPDIGQMGQNGTLKGSGMDRGARCDAFRAECPKFRT